MSLDSTDKLAAHAFARMRRFNPQLMQLAASTSPPVDESAYDLP